MIIKKDMQEKSSRVNLFQIFTGIVLFLDIFIGAILRFHNLGKLSLWNDEIFSYNSAISTFNTIFQRDHNMIFFHILAHYWLSILPRISEGSLRTISVLFSIINIPVVFFLGKSVWSGKKMPVLIGLITATLVTLNAYVIQYAQEFRGYSLLLLLSSLSSLFLIKAVEKSICDSKSFNYWWMWYVLSTVAAVYTHFFALFILIAQVVSLIILLIGNIKTFPFRQISISGVVIICLLASLGKAVLQQGPGQISWISIPTTRNITQFAIEITGNQGMLLLYLCLIYVVIGLIIYVRTLSHENTIQNWKFTLIICNLFIPIFTTLLISKLITPIFLDKYLSLVIPYLFILVAISIVTLGNFGAKNRIHKFEFVSHTLMFLVILIVLLALGTKTYFDDYQKEDWRGVSKFLIKNCLSSSDLRLYYPDYMEPNTVFYNVNLKSQINNLNEILNKNLNSGKLNVALSKNYRQVCLILGSFAGQNQKKRENLESILSSKFHKQTKYHFFEIIVEIYK